MLSFAGGTLCYFACHPVVAIVSQTNILCHTCRFPNIACELLTCDVGVINDKLGNEEPLLETLYAFLEQPSPLNPLLASFFSKTIGNLITRKTEQVTQLARPSRKPSQRVFYNTLLRGKTV